MKLYGSLNNRMEENRMYCDEIKVGTGMTEYRYSDREAYEVIEVRDQKHVTVRKLTHIKVGDTPMDNSWKLVSDESNPCRNLAKRGDWWYWEDTVTAEHIKALDNLEKDEKTIRLIGLAVNGWDTEKIMAKGKQTKYQRVNVSFGVADYYYDYEF